MTDAIVHKNALLAGLAAVGAFIARALGGWDASLQVLTALIVADYIAGITLAAIFKRSRKSKSGALSSAAGFRGLVKKGIIFLIIWIAELLDRAIGASYIRTAVVLFFVGNEGISLLENIGQMGVPFPTFLKRALEALRDKGDSGGEE